MAAQEVFMRTILRPGASERDVSDLFKFYRPRKRPRSTSSAILARLSEKQHDVMYALAGCSDVCSTMSRVDKPVGLAGRLQTRHTGTRLSATGLRLLAA